MLDKQMETPIGLSSCPDTRLQWLIDAATASLNDLPEDMPASLACLKMHGLPLGRTLAGDPARYEELYVGALALCDQGKFEQALQLALHLVAGFPGEARYLFVAASCLQRTGQHEIAGAMYSLCLLNDARNVAAMFRLAECLAAKGDIEAARQGFEEVFERGRDQDCYRQLQDMASEKLVALRQA